MTDFYYQIKGKLAEPSSGMFGGVSNWAFPPLFCGKVTAENKIDAKKMIDQEYGKSFPLRVLAKDLETNEFLLSIEEIKPGSRIADLFELKTCEQCENTFYVIDKYNDANETNKSFQFCSNQCQMQNNEVRSYLRGQEINKTGSSNPIIYRITNRHTQLCYIGKTTQIFTLRWYQHFFQHGSCKFHLAVKQSHVTDWLFEVHEVVQIPADIKSSKDIEALIMERERYWINHFNSIDNGYNSI